jgi:hypothetical protein
MTGNEALVIRRTHGVFVTVALWTFVSLIGVVGLFVSSDGTGRIIAAALISTGAVLIARALRLEVVADEDGLHVTGLRRRVFEWGELRGADVMPGSLVGRTWYLRVFRDGDSPIRLPDLSEFARSKDVESLAISEMARHIERRVRAAGGRPIE